MFQSIKFIKSLGFEGKKIEALYKVIDSNFEEETSSQHGQIQAIIKVYENRNLNVAKALLLWFKFEADKNSKLINYTLSEMITDYLSSNPDSKYKEDLENYLLLI